MSALSINPTFPVFTDTDGQPLESGYIWIGTVNLDPQMNPIAVYWDGALTMPAAQPIRTLSGYPANNGTPARIYSNADYSIRVQNKNGSVVYSAPAATDRYNSAVVTGADASNVTYTPAGTGAVTTNVQAKLRETVSVKDFGAVGDGVTDDTAAILAAFAHIKDVGGGVIDFPNSDDSIYLCSHGFVVPTNTVIMLNGCTLLATTNWNQAQPEPPTGGTYRAFFAVIGSLVSEPLVVDLENTAIIGDNAVIDMRYDDQIGVRRGSTGIAVTTTPAPHLENLWKVHDIIIKDLTVKNALWYSFDIEGSKNVSLQNCKSIRPYQLGFAVICGWNVSLISCAASYSRNGAGNQGVGFWNEANETWQLLRNIRYYNCVAEYNNRSGYRYYNDGKDVEVSVFAFGNISRFNQWDPATGTQYSSPGDAGHVVQKSGTGLAEHLIELVGCVAEEEYGAGFKILRTSGSSSRQNFLLENCVAYNCNKQDLSSYSRSAFHVSGTCDSHVAINNPLVIAPVGNVNGYGVGIESAKAVYITGPQFVGNFEFQLLTGGTSGVARKDAGFDVAWDDTIGGHTGGGTKFYKPIRLASWDQTTQPVIGTDTYTNELAIWQTDANEFVGLYTRDDSNNPAYLDFRNAHRRLRGTLPTTSGNINAQSVETHIITVLGAMLGDYVEATYTVSLNNALILQAQVTAADTVTVAFHNPSAATVTRVLGSIVVNVIAFS